MSNFQPIPGVRYVIDLGTENDGYPDHVEWLYAPWWKDDVSPWLDEDMEFHEWDEKCMIVDVAWNPHPPTRTEWAAQSGDAVIGSFGKGGAEAEAEHYRTNWPQEPVKLLRREVSEWQEVDQ